MRPISVEEAANAVGGKIKIVGNASSKNITKVLMDSRLDVKEALFVAIKGEKVDGHQFISKVFEGGAAAALCNYIPDDVTEGVCILVDDTLEALQKLAEWYRQTLDITVVGISGSVGKTSTKEIIYSVLSAKFKVQKTHGNYNNEIGLPLTVLEIDEETEVEVLEMGISDFGEMRLLARIARPDICVLTNIGQSHLEALGTRDGIVKAKTEMFEYRNPNGPIFLNGDDDKLSQITEVNGTKTIFFGFDSEMYAHPENVESLGLAGTKMTVCLGNRKFDARIRMIGNHNLQNAMVASAVGEYLGMTDEELIKGLEQAETISGRSFLIPHGEGFIIDDCYNAAPNSMKAALNMLLLAKTGRKVAILGDMFELGSMEVQMHREIGIFASSLDIDLLICVGDLSRNIYDAVIEKGASYKTVWCRNLEDCLQELPYITFANDNILVKASHGMHFTKIVERLKG